MTDEERRRLLVLADHLEKAATEAKGRAEPLAALALLEGAVMARAAMATPAERLTAGKHSPTVNGVMTEDHRAAISQAHARRNPMLKAARARGYRTLGMLAKALDVTPSFLSQVAHGTKKLPPDLGKRIRDLTGWEP